ATPPPPPPLTPFARGLLADETAGDARATLGVAIGSDVQPHDADLDALAALSTSGHVVRTGAATFATRTLVGPAAGLTVANGTGVGGNPTLGLANDLAALEGLAGTGIAVRTAADTWAQRTITGSATVAVANGDGVSGDPTLSVPDGAITLAKMAPLATARLIGRDTAGTGSPEDLTISQALDLIGSAAHGDILFRGASGWQKLAAGTGGQYLRTAGPNADPGWDTIAGGGDLLAANNLSDVASAPAAFANIKQGATDSASGVVELATSAEALAGTDAVRAVTSAGLASGLSKASSGYVKLPGGLIIQWGMTGSPSNGTRTTSFPVAFPAVCCSVQVTMNVGNNPALLRSVYVTSASRTSFVTEHRSIDNTGVIAAAGAAAFFIAIGY
ncbi:gp53-like domain-containing protein, partial [Rhodovulum sp. PH10]|uniref:gp53-like domain-containing protein n=1 Tax=Rhodovulum sp. PH10 TaxID=1187851 RepID=UPI00058AD541